MIRVLVSECDYSEDCDVIQSRDVIGGVTNRRAICTLL